MREGDNHTLAALTAFAGFFAFSIIDAFSRHLITGGHSVFLVGTTFQALATLILLACSAKLGGIASIAASPNKKFHVTRGALYLVSVTTNLYAFAHLPFALVYSLLFTGSLWAILFSRFVTGEVFRPRDTLAVLGGMAGAIIVLRPWDVVTFDWTALLPLLSAMMYGTRSLIDRKIAPRETPLSMAVWPMLVTVPVYGALTLFLADNLHMPSLPDAGIMLLSGALVGVGMVCLPWAFRHAPITIVGPFHYTQLIWGTLIGLIFFDQHVDLWTMVGGAIIVGSGLSVMLKARPKN